MYQGAGLSIRVYAKYRYAIMQPYGRPANGLAFLCRKSPMPPSSQQAYASLQDYSKKRRSTQDIQNEAESKYNVSGISSRLSGLRTMVGNLENSLENVDPSVRSRTSSGFATEGQNQALINREQQPILGNLSKQQRAYGDTQQEFSLSSALAGELARSIRSDDESGYQRLLDQYNASLAQEQAAEAKRQFDESQRLEQQKIKSASGATGGYDIAGLLGSLGLGLGLGGGGSTAPAADPTQQKAYNDAKKLLGKDPKRIQQEYEAIKKSAGYGNPYDKIKLQIIEQLKPEVKNFGRNAIPLTRSIPTAVSLTPKYSGLPVGVANSGSIQVR